MSSNSSSKDVDPKDSTGGGGNETAAAPTAAVPLVSSFRQKKKPASKPRVRPTLKKNGPVKRNRTRPEGVVPNANAKKSAVSNSSSVSDSASSGQSQVQKVVGSTNDAASSKTATPPSNSTEIDSGEGEKTSAPGTTSETVPAPSSATESGNKVTTGTSETGTSEKSTTPKINSSSSSKSGATSTRSRKVGRVMPRKNIRKPNKPIRRGVMPPSKRLKSGFAVNAKKGKGISVGSTMPTSAEKQKQVGDPSSSKSIESEKNNDVSPPPKSTSISEKTSEDTVKEASEKGVAASTRTTRRSRPVLPEEENIIPYQHLGQIDPALNIAPMKPGEKSMKDFCTKFKIPKAERGKKSGPNASASGNDGDNDNANDAGGGGNNNNTEGDQNTTAATEGLGNVGTAPTGDTSGADGSTTGNERSGPLVEIINGEIVVKESTMIVGARQTTEEVDREMGGAVVEEETTGIQATYNSFTTRQKTTRWTIEETRKFYISLRQCGTDFSTMESFFNGSDDENKRNRKQLKSKYKRECRKNLHLIDMAMDPRVQLPLDMSVFGELDMDAVQNTVVPLGQAKAVTPDLSTIDSN
mmetsp:Transcript_8767/g.12499  ORF Transcript_8767/g.12499 Transcript_8767/m.12499 type:complete len:582 (+) Transcript_8767:15-1760(+)